MRTRTPSPIYNINVDIVLYVYVAPVNENVSMQP